jgi:hypothetical protein
VLAFRPDWSPPEGDRQTLLGPRDSQFETGDVARPEYTDRSWHVTSACAIAVAG